MTPNIQHELKKLMNQRKHSATAIYTQWSYPIRTTIFDTPADEDNSVPSREANSMESINKVTSTRSEREKKTTSDPEYVYDKK